MKDLNKADQANCGQALEDRLKFEAQQIPQNRDAALIAQVMRTARAEQRPAVVDHSAVKIGSTPWLMAGATAVSAVVIAAVLIMVVTSEGEESTGSGLPRQANLPRIVESNVDPVLASREQDLAGEMQRIRADFDSISRFVSLRLESDTQ